MSLDIALPSVHIADLRTSMLFKWKMSPDEQLALEKYYLLYWSTNYYMRQSNNQLNGGMIIHQGFNYIPVELKPIEGYTRVVLSFRKRYGTYEGIVLVRPALEFPKGV